MSSKMALKDAGRVLGYEHAYLNELTNTIPSFNGKNMDLEDTLEEIPEIIEANKTNPELFELAVDIQGIPRSQSVHASGVIVTPQELDVTIPLGMSKGTTVTQYDGDTLEDLGYLKCPSKRGSYRRNSKGFYLRQLQGTISSALTTRGIPPRIITYPL